MPTSTDRAERKPLALGVYIHDPDPSDITVVRVPSGKVQVDVGTDVTLFVQGLDELDALLAEATKQATLIREADAEAVPA